MRRLSTMKAKRRKSETTSSDVESEENGVTRNATSDNSEANEGSDHDEPQSTTETISPPKKSVAKKRSSRGRGKAKEDHADDSPPETAPHDAEEKTVGVESQEDTKTPTTNKRRKKQEKASTSHVKEDSDEAEYEVEKIVGQRTIKGRRQFLVRWKGYGEDADTWEQEKDLNCEKLIEEFLELEADAEAQEAEKVKKPTKSPRDKRSRKSKGGNKKIDDNTDTAKDETGDGKEPKEFEVEKIIEVHFKKDKNREFLIRWKGFGPNDDTWEPEEHLNCPHLIEKFMHKVEQAKISDTRELRTNPVHTKRYTLNSPLKGRRVSRRHMDKQRATYHEYDQ